MTDPVCPKCGTPPRVAVIERTRVRCVYEEGGCIGKVISTTKGTKVVIAYECGGGHSWPVAGDLKETAE